MATWVNLLDVMFPVGSFYISRQATSPASIIGGSWTQVTNAVLRGSTSIGYTGSDTCTLTVNQMPYHTHLGNNSWGVQVVSGGIATDGTITGNWGVGLLQEVQYPGTGGGQAHSIVQRSYNCFIWYRTA